MTIEELPTPALVVEYPVLLRNLQQMQQRAQQWGVRLRPHAKTHKCLPIARLQQQLGACGLTVSTLAEAHFFAEAGIEDLTWAFPLPLWAIEPALELARRVQLRLLLDNLTAAEALAQACARRRQRVNVWLEIDCGAQRSGLPPNSEELLRLAAFVDRSPFLELDGLLTHAGHAYRATTPEEIRRIALQEQELMLEAAHRLQRAGIPVPSISIGSTPTVRACQNVLPGITEIRPGNYVFFDYTQLLLGSCRLEECALTVIATVVSRAEGRLVIDAGALALSLDPGPVHLLQHPSFGAVLTSEGGQLSIDPHLRIVRLSQEHGVLVADPPDSLQERYPIGSRIRILENHSCLTAALYDSYWVCDNCTVVEQWAIARQRQ
jgi:D-serine deaminase-like pyridoxal phosphate-dependent protein